MADTLQNDLNADPETFVEDAGSTEDTLSARNPGGLSYLQELSMVHQSRRSLSDNSGFRFHKARRVISGDFSPYDSELSGPDAACGSNDRNGCGLVAEKERASKQSRSVLFELMANWE